MENIVVGIVFAVVLLMYVAIVVSMLSGKMKKPWE